MEEKIDRTRPDADLAEFIDATLRLTDQVGIRGAAAIMQSAGVPDRVIARVLCDTDQRRPPAQPSLH